MTTNTAETIHEHFTGTKFNEALSIADCAKAIRSDIKAAIKAGTLPAGLVTSVRTSLYAGGGSIRVKVTACPGLAIADIDYVRNAMLGINRVHINACERHTKQARALITTLKAMVNAYNEDRSDPMTDYYCVHFYAHVDFDHALEASDRAAVDAALRAGADVESIES